MGLFSFIKNAGSKIFGGADSPEEKAEKVRGHVEQFGFDLSQISFVAEDDKIRVSGTAKNLDEKQKILATAGNVDGVDGVEDDLILAEPLKFEFPDFSKTMYTVKSGDNLSKISKEVYGNPNLYNKIFEANQPMLKHPDKIYPGQVLYIPPQEINE
ncbi:MAG: peptidoglycan-binding protein LysM [Weeksellaceae bacterium]